MKSAKIENGKVVNVIIGWTEGFVECPEDTKIGALYDGVSFSEAPEPTPTPEDINFEAQRRILALCPEWQQRNLTAQAAQLAAKGMANWTLEEQAAWDAGVLIWDKITAIRARSNELQASLPLNYRDDTLWV